MRVLFVNRMLSIERGGGETFDLEIARHLAQLGCQVAFLSGLPLFSNPRLSYFNSSFRSQVSSFTVRTPYFGWFPWDRVKGGWRLRVADFIWFEKAAARWILRRAGEFDVIQCCELPTLTAILKDQGCRVPVVIRVTAPNVHDPRGGLARADAVIASGTSVERLRASVRPDCADIPNAVDTSMFRPHDSDFRSRHAIAPDELLLLYVARFQDFKNHRMLIMAFDRLVRGGVNARLLLAGSGPLQASVRAQCAAAGLADRVIFLGEVPFAELPDIYAAADIMAISSDYESFCFAALEAMASGLPIVTTDCGWVPRLIERDRGGVVTPAGNAPAFAAALGDLAADAERRRRLGTWSRERAVQAHGWDVSARKLLALYEGLSRRN